LVRLLLLLLGTEWIRRYRYVLAVIGLAWLGLAIMLFLDCLDGVVYFPLLWFGWLILIEGLAMLSIARSGRMRRRNLQQTRAAIVIVLGLLVVFQHDFADIILAIIFGTAFAVDGALRIASAVVVRFAGYKKVVFNGISEIVIAIIIFLPWPFYYTGTVEFCIALALSFSGWSLLRLYLRLRALPPGESLHFLYSRGWPAFKDLPKPDHRGPPPAEKLLVRVWTARGTADHPVSRPIVDRYIGAEDEKGTISTGHSALEVKPDVYISHYPAVDIDHSPDDFIRLLRATHDNDVEGSFQPSYAFESKEWCECTETVEFERYDPVRLRAYWQRYRQDNMYNLTSRNCSSTVIHALETALEGVLAKRRYGLAYFVRVFLSPELMVAAHLRKRADTMTWTPGLVLDYSLALFGALNPPHISWVRFVRYLKAMFWRMRGTMATSRQQVPRATGS